MRIYLSIIISNNNILIITITTSSPFPNLCPTPTTIILIITITTSSPFPNLCPTPTTIMGNDAIVDYNNYAVSGWPSGLRRQTQG